MFYQQRHDKHIVHFQLDSLYLACPPALSELLPRVSSISRQAHAPRVEGFQGALLNRQLI